MLIHSKELPLGATLRAAVCVIGTGIAGACVALELARSGIDVLAVEAGELHFSKSIQRAYAGEVVDSARHPPLERNRERRLGGTSAVWGGRCVPFEDCDFLSRQHVPHSGWPMQAEEMRPWLEKAHSYLGLGTLDYDAESALQKEDRHFIPDLKLTEFDDRRIYRFSYPTRFAGELLQESRNGRLRILLHAPCLAIHREKGSSRVESITIAAGESGRAHTVMASHFVIASGALETARLLLWSGRNDPQLMGDGSRLVGRFYMTHLYGEAGGLAVRPADSARKVKSGFVRTRDGIYARHMILAKPQAQCTHRLLNVSFGLENPPFYDAAHRNAILSAMFFAKAALGRPLPADAGAAGNTFNKSATAHAWNVAAGIPSLCAFAADWTRRRLMSRRKLPAVYLHSREGRYRLMYSSEQSPCADSTVSLSPEMDRYGVPQARVDWRYNKSDVAAVKRSIMLLESEINATPNLHLETGQETLSDRLEASFRVGSHQIGTTRMSEAPAEGVVDRECRVHNVPNLFVAGASVFPTSGYANPSLMIAALALRVAETIRAELRV